MPAELAAREAAEVAAHLGRAGRQGAPRDPARREVDRDRRRLAEPGALELLRRHLPAAVERLPRLLRQPERRRDPRPEGLPRPRLAARGARHRRRVPQGERHPAGHRRRPRDRREDRLGAARHLEPGCRRSTARRKGLTVVMDRCIKVEHARFHGGLHLLGFDTGQISSRRGEVVSRAASPGCPGRCRPRSRASGPRPRSSDR